MQQTSQAPERLCGGCLVGQRGRSGLPAQPRSPLGNLAPDRGQQQALTHQPAGLNHRRDGDHVSITALQLTLLSSSSLGATVAARRSEQKIPFSMTSFSWLPQTSPVLLAALLLGKAKDPGMEIINDVLCNHLRDLLGHKYYCIRLHSFNIYSYGQHTARGLRRTHLLAGQSCSQGRAQRRALHRGWSCSRRSCCHSEKN